MRQISPNQRVAVLLSQDLGYCRRVLSGVLRFAGERRDWHFRDGPPDTELLPALAKWRPHGIIVHLHDRHLAGGLARIGCPVVSTTDTLTAFDLPLVDVDNSEVGRDAARYFLQRGFRNFAYFGSQTARFSQNREQGFQEVLAEAGHVVHSHHAEFLPKPPSGDPWRSLGRRVDEWLAGLPNPIAIFCSNDLPARRIAEACERGGLAVPDEIALLGVDNDSSECRLASPHLSSIDTPAENIGYEAARMLADLMDGRTLPLRRMMLPPLFVATRSSTDRWACSHPTVTKALDYIRDECARAVNVSDVASRVGVSRRQLERLFRQELSRSVLTAIQDAKVALARELIASTNLRIAEIAERSGFGNPKRLHAVFRKQIGFSPAEFRRQTQSS
ncbi:MAG: substrate-binding domain-containing protein [Verrucomicrobiota bacterium]